MNTNRRNFIGALGATGLAFAQDSAESDTATPVLNSQRELEGKVAIVECRRRRPRPVWV